MHKLTTKHKNFTMGGRNPYQELENAYVAQICLTWEALNWNYNYFRCKNAEKEMASSCCPARVAQEFQQFQVLLQRFIENEPYELGRRPEIFGRVRFSSPRLLLVPEFRGILHTTGLNSFSALNPFIVCFGSSFLVNIMR